MNAIPSLLCFRNRDSGILNTYILSTKMAVRGARMLRSSQEARRCCTPGSPDYRDVRRPGAVRRTANTPARVGRRSCAAATPTDCRSSCVCCSHRVIHGFARGTRRIMSSVHVTYGLMCPKSRQWPIRDLSTHRGTRAHITRRRGRRVARRASDRQRGFSGVVWQRPPRILYCTVLYCTELYFTK